jgi:predicted Kef-type K+ transport protein/voltage-gated potassium channel Kch
VSTLAIYLLIIFGCGLVAMAVRLPPMVGFLGAGFVLYAMGAEQMPYLDMVASLGVTLLFFSIGLKLDIRTLGKPEVWLPAAVQMTISTVLGIGLFAALMLTGRALFDLTLHQMALLGFAIAFSSTVFVVKILEERSDTTTLYGRIAIGILIVEDLAAVVFISVSRGELPSPWALALVLLIPAAVVFRRMLVVVGHGELQVVYGILLALVPGYWLFDAVGLKGDLGALVMGAMLASHPAASDLAKHLWSLKELFLVGFFVSIGLIGTPNSEALLVVGLLMLVLPIKGFVFHLLLAKVGLRHRNGILAGLSLTNFSEFGLIVVAISASTGWLPDEWLVILGLTVAMSFLLSAGANQRALPLAAWWESKLPPQDPNRLLPMDRPIDVAGVDALVLGMGRVGRAAYRKLYEEGHHVLGVEHDAARVETLLAEGKSVVRADATDRDFWLRVGEAGHIKLAVLAMPFHHSNIDAYELLSQCRFNGKVAAIAQYDEDVEELKKLGADSVLHLYGGAGTALAEGALEAELTDNHTTEDEPPQ